MIYYLPFDILFDYTSNIDKMQSAKSGYSRKELLKESKIILVLFTSKAVNDRIVHADR